MKDSSWFPIRWRMAFAVIVVCGVVVIATVLVTNLFAASSIISTVDAGELTGVLQPEKAAVLAVASESQPILKDEGTFPDLSGAVGWLNSAALSGKSLRGKVVLVDIWTYSCINSLRQLPYMKSWAEKYKDSGLVVIGVHAPEFGFEKDRGNVERAVHDYKITYPVAIDSDHTIWSAFNNEYWPADYFIDAKGRIRYHHFGEGEYDKSERVIQELLKENGATGLDGRTVSVSGGGVEAAPSEDVRSPETYVGYRRAEDFASPERVAQDSRKTYSPPANPGLNRWGLSGSWKVGGESALL
jgi:thiol-disulfide isomerase/thioredoxin